MKTKQKKEYFNLLEPDYPLWLDEYINTKNMLKQKYISVTCGKIYSKLFDLDDYSSLDHSIAVALIIWHFTHDKKQTISGLFHDIATPTFKHCIDYLNGDYIKQESTEDLTSTIIEDSKDIMTLLKKDKINVNEINDYKIYPIADNEIPKLSADRLEYTLSNALIVFKICDFEDIKEIYNDIIVTTNEDGIKELSFKTKSIARKFVKISSILSICYRDDETRFYMQAFADILKKVSNEGLIEKQDLYNLKEKEIINIINKSNYKDIFNKLLNITKIKTSKKEPKDMYYVNIVSKVRYIDPLVNNERISNECKITKKMILKNISYDMNKYLYVDKEFNILK